MTPNGTVSHDITVSVCLNASKTINIYRNTYDMAFENLNPGASCHFTVFAVGPDGTKSRRPCNFTGFTRKYQNTLLHVQRIYSTYSLQNMLIYVKLFAFKLVLH